MKICPEVSLLSELNEVNRFIEKTNPQDILDMESLQARKQHILEDLEDFFRDTASCGEGCFCVKKGEKK
jgi:hypothetical protein